MAIDVRHTTVVIRHDNHIPPLTLTKRTFVSSNANSITLSNVSSGTTMRLSFDGVNVLNILPGGSFCMDFGARNCYWTCGDGVGAMQVIVGSED